MGINIMLLETNENVKLISIITAVAYESHAGALGVLVKCLTYLLYIVLNYCAE